MLVQTQTSAGGASVDQAVAYQGDPVHDGSQSDALTPPLSKVWSESFGGPVSYPLIAQNTAFVTAAPNPSTYGTTLYAIDLSSGAMRWSVGLGGTYWWSGLAYDNGQVFTLNYDGQLRAFDATTGNPAWATQLPGQSAFTSAPTASGGMVYTAGAGSGGTLYAVNESTGALVWSAPVENGDESSPVVTSSGVYVSYACQQVYDFDPLSGTLLWHHTSSCEGGGGRTPVIGDGKLFVRDPVLGNVVLDPSTGAATGTFSAGPAPSISGTTAYLLNGGTLSAVNLSTSALDWSFTGDGSLTSAPLVANGIVYEGSSSGNVYAVSAATGSTVWSANVSSPVAAPDEQNVSQPLTGMAVGQGTLLVPATNTLVAFRSTPDFAMTLKPAALQVRKNHSGSVTVTVSANAFFSGTVTLSRSGVPSSVKTTLSPTSVILAPSGSGHAMLTVTPGGGSRSFAMTVQACSGSTCHSATLSVTVS
jgi:outer membrane protein assembly factor BamB